MDLGEWIIIKEGKRALLNPRLLGSIGFIQDTSAGSDKNVTTRLISIVPLSAILKKRYSSRIAIGQFQKVRWRAAFAYRGYP